MAVENKRKKFLVTGGCGFIGGELIKELMKLFPSCYIYCIDDLSSGSWDRLPPYFNGEFIPKKISEVDLNQLGKLNHIFHQAAITDTMITDVKVVMEQNFEEFKKICDYAVKKRIPLTYASSAAVYGQHPHRPCIVGQNEIPLNIYGYSKLQCDNYVRNILRDKKKKIVGLRYFNVYGPGEESKKNTSQSVLKQQIWKEVTQNHRAKLFGEFDQKRDFIHISDVISINIASMNLNPGVYNVGTGVATSFAELNRLVWLCYSQKRVQQPASINNRNPEAYQNFTQADLTSPELFGTSTSPIAWTPKVTIEAGVKSYVDWLEKNK